MRNDAHQHHDRLGVAWNRDESGDDELDRELSTLQFRSEDFAVSPCRRLDGGLPHRFPWVVQPCFYFIPNAFPRLTNRKISGGQPALCAPSQIFEEGRCFLSAIRLDKEVIVAAAGNEIRSN